MGAPRKLKARTNCCRWEEGWCWYDDEWKDKLKEDAPLPNFHLPVPSSAPLLANLIVTQQPKENNVYRVLASCCSIKYRREKFCHSLRLSKCSLCAFSVLWTLCPGLRPVFCKMGIIMPTSESKTLNEMKYVGVLHSAWWWLCTAAQWNRASP